MSSFKFKQFIVKQDKSTMKVGTDAVLLGTWVDIRTTDKNILEIGIGCGVISLIIAQRYSHITIDGIDIDKASVEEANDNFQNSPWSGRITAINDSLQTYNTAKKYDFIVSNPPFFNNSLQCPDEQRNNARHTATLPYTDLLLYSYQLLNNNGILAIILPYNEGNDFIKLSTNFNYKIRRTTIVYPTPTSRPKRLLIELIKNTENSNSTPADNDINRQQNMAIEITRHKYTDEYIALTKDFYLKM